MAFFETVTHKDVDGDEMYVQAGGGNVEIEVTEDLLVFSAAEARALANTLLNAAATSISV